MTIKGWHRKLTLKVFIHKLCFVNTLEMGNDAFSFDTAIYFINLTIETYYIYVDFELYVCTTSINIFCLMHKTITRFFEKGKMLNG